MKGVGPQAYTPGMAEEPPLHLDELEDDEIKRLFADGRVAVLVGSGVSIFPPTNLPSGQAFTKSLYESLFFDDAAGQGKPRIKTIERQNEEVEKLFGNFPFERAMERCPEQNTLLTLIKDFFHKENPNPIHEALALGLLTKRFESIVTTNYDCCLDVALGFPADCSTQNVAGNVRRVVFKDGDPPVNLGPQEQVYFKIHGSTGDPSGASLLFTTRHERAMDEYKRLLLERLWKGRILLVIGYSGLDFEICPAIPNLKPKRVIWNFLQEEEGEKANARNVLSKTRGRVLVGEMQKLLPTLLEGTGVRRSDLAELKPRNDKSGDVGGEIEKRFGPLTRRLWWLRILVAMTCAGPALRACGELLKDGVGDAAARNEVLRARGGALYYGGLYRQAARELERLAALARGLPAVDDAALNDLYLTIYDCWKSHGSFRRARRYLRLARASARKYEGESKQEIEDRVRLKRLHLLSHLYVWARRLKLPPAARRIQESARPVIEKLTETFAKAGVPADFQQMELWSRRLGIPVESIIPAGLYAPPSSSEGYSHMGDLMGRMIAFRDEAKEMSQDSSPEVVNRAESLAALAELLGIYPEAWKLHVLIAKRTFRVNGKRARDNVREGWKAFMKCEHFAPLRIPFFLMRFMD